ncbi:MAG: peptidoglycan-associated lipoprotein Pal [Deltaproteobacteria bacterium]|jgi:peptidoglycan-associated lipoprotein|nr:peptidoglycan-associated lipoprotein Pal [Deltaproteobacteria bacterium]
MQKKRRIYWVMLLVIPGLMFSVSCQKKLVDATPEPVVQEEVQEEVVVEEEVAVAPVPKIPDAVMQEDIYFEFDKSTLTPAAQDNLMQKAEWLRENPDATVTIGGHCDERGTNEYNLALGDRRAESAKAFLVDLGIDAFRLTTISYGEERPVDPRHNEEAWAKNRRGHFEVN